MEPVESNNQIQLQDPRPILYLSHRSLVGALAHFAIAASPIFPPRNLEVALKKFYDVTLPHFNDKPVFVVNHTPTGIMPDRFALRTYLEPIFESIPEIMDWNKTQNEVDGKIAYPTGHTQFQIVSSFDTTSATAENDFVDIGALAQNVSNYFHFEALRNEAFDADFNASNPQHPAIMEPYPIVMREDGELPKEQIEESFEQWTNRVAEQVERYNDLTNENNYVWISRVDGGYMGTSPSAFSWLYVNGIRERIQMMDAEEGKTACIGFSPSEQKWYGWSRACRGFGIDSIAKEGDSVTKSGYSADYIAQHPEKDYRVPVGFTAKTLVDAKRMAIAYAESMS